MNSSATLPPAILDGASIGVFNPSEKITNERATYLRLGAKRLQSKGWIAQFPSNNCFDEWAELRDAVTRAEEFCAVYSNFRNSAVIAAWAGSNSADLLPHLDFHQFFKAQKPIIGYGDNCTFLNEVALRTGLITYYGPNYLGKLNLLSDRAMERGFKQIGRGCVIELKSQFSAFSTPHVQGRLIGGSLRSFWNHFSDFERLSLVDTPAILFFETASLNLKGLEKILCEIRDSRLFRLLSGVVIGQTKLITPEDALRVVIDRFGRRVAVLKCDDFGHSGADNPALPVGSMVTLSSNARLNILETKVR